MTVTSKQFTYLNEMGISLWQRKSLIEESTETEQPTAENTLKFSLEELANQKLFQDIVLALGSELSDIEQQQNQLIVGDMYWQFSDQQAISLDNGILITPELNSLSSSAQHKKALWQLLLQHQ